MRDQEGTYDEALLLIMERHGYEEETYYTFSYSPVPNDRGGTGGIICANTADTERIVGERQLAMLRELATRTADARSWQEACRASAEALAQNPRDIPFALLYVLDADPRRFRLAGATGIAEGHAAAPPAIDASSPWPLAEVLQSGRLQLVGELAERFGELPGGAWPRPPRQAALVPMTPAGETGRPGVLVVGLNPFRLFDERYRRFLELAAGQIAASLASAQAYEDERRRAEALAEIDRAKTAFFGNVSHELRTPLTLLLGPVEDLLRGTHGELDDARRSQLELVHRNALRLQKLVNSLLEFSRLEAGRAQACYEPVDLAALTRDVASAFQSAVEQAGLGFAIDCPPLPEPIFVDPGMWETIVLNLVSNAFKFTLEGRIAVSLRMEAAGVVLRVADTGVGVPEAEVTRLFDRFHRIEGTRARTHEGSGIGLALVRELVGLHGGAVRAESVLGAGSTFTVTIPRGSEHLPKDRIGAPRAAASTRIGAAPFVQEALRWLPNVPTDAGEPARDLASARAHEAPHAGEAPMPSSDGLEGATILLADDNADMRNYVRRLLEPHWTVVAVEDGEKALASARARRPDLILTDVMMPAMDGFALLRELRAHDATRSIPVVMLSARAGEEAKVEGLMTGADDYLVKPFSARELLARVRTHLELGRLHQREQRARAEAEALARMSEQALELSDMFVGILGHDLRSPLSAITTSAELLLHKEANERIVRPIERIRTSALRMARMIEQILDFTRARIGGGIPIAPAPVQLQSLVAQIVGELEGTARCAIVLEASGDTEGEWDGDRLAQVISNLLGNALEHGEPDEPVRVVLEGSEPDVVRMSVWNGGVIPEQLLPNLFDPFRRISAEGGAARPRGLGLGLYIVEQVVAAHGGHIEVQSSASEGTSFVITLPRRASKPPRSGP